MDMHSTPAMAARAVSAACGGGRSKVGYQVDDAPTEDVNELVVLLDDPSL